MTHGQPLIQPLDERLEAFEKALQTTRVAGELSDWLRAVSTRLTELRKEFERQIDTDHRQAFRQIVKEDLVLHPTVARLREADQEIVQDIETAEVLIAGVKAQLNASKDQREDIQRAGAVFELGQRILFAMRKQEQDLTTWYIEAFQRENGVGD